MQETPAEYALAEGLFLDHTLPQFDPMSHLQGYSNEDHFRETVNWDLFKIPQKSMKELIQDLENRPEDPDAQDEMPLLDDKPALPRYLFAQELKLELPLLESDPEADMEEYYRQVNSVPKTIDLSKEWLPLVPLDREKGESLEFPSWVAKLPAKLAMELAEENKRAAKMKIPKLVLPEFKPSLPEYLNTHKVGICCCCRTISHARSCLKTRT